MQGRGEEVGSPSFLKLEGPPPQDKDGADVELLPSNLDALPPGSAITQLVLCKTSPQSCFSATGDGLGGTPLGPRLWKMMLNHKQGCRVCDWHDAQGSVGENKEGHKVRSAVPWGVRADTALGCSA